MEVVRIENISKLYRLGQIGTGTLSHDLKRWVAKVQGKEDPFMKLGVENDRTKAATSDYTWALQEISYNIKQGDTLGIIGKNGAGKSTLLKILSRVTAPTTGNLKIRGRLASLLEVGTGFNPEMTGKENIYMNGAILGMTKKEITSKFEEIVDFSGVAMYINTPVKRYSSGMYVRLAFAVAAHLEPEILIVDEVLAVGDADFQKKCLGKMNDVAHHGRTIIFVSHNMQAVQSLCTTALYLKAGRLVDCGKTEQVINNYLNKELRNCLKQNWEMQHAPGNNFVKILSAEVIPHFTDEKDVIDTSVPFDLTFSFFNLIAGQIVNLSLMLLTNTGSCVFNVATKQQQLKKDVYTATLKIPGNFLNDGVYSIKLMVVREASSVLFQLDDILAFEVVDVPRTSAWYGKWEGAVRPMFLDFSYC
jgi:lipopolysaccharide transport system ATP-binding protein